MEPLWREKRLRWPVLSAAFLLSLGLGYLYLEGGRHSQLVGYFVYMTCASTFIPLPTPPYVIAMGKIFNPHFVAFIGAIGQCIAAFVEYYFLIWLTSKGELQERIKASRLFQRLAHWFERAAFPCIVWTGFTPIPFEPFRFAAILIRYNIWKYLLAIFLGRYPRYYLLAKLGVGIPDSYLAAMLIVLFVFPLLMAVAKRRHGKHEQA